MTDFRRVFIDIAPIIYFLENSSLYMPDLKGERTHENTMCVGA